MTNKIGNFELNLYYFIWISTNLHALFKLWHSQNEIMNSNSTTNVADLEKGWIIPNYVDNSDLEWTTWKYYLRTSFIYLILQYLVSEAIRTIFSPFLMYWYIMSSISFIGYNIGIMHLGFALALPTIFAVIILTKRNKFCVWTTSIFLLLFYNYLKQNPIFWDHFSSGSKDEDVYMILFAYGWIELRCISFTLDNIDKRGITTKSKPQKYHDILNMFAYVMYLPLFFNGPHILYEDFEKCYTTSKPLYEKLRWFTMNIVIFLIYMFLLELSFHYIYFLALKENIELIKDLPTIALCGGGLWMGLEFHMKYVISYGMSGAFALLDNIDPPPTPRCIARIHVYSQMWRYFDVGLYNFLIKYIYKPCLRFITIYSIFPKSINKLLASLSTFLFILMWHGTIKEIFIWAALNFLGITCESMAQIISRGSWYCDFKNRILKTDAMEQRFIALLCAPLLAVSAVSNFYLFAGLNVGNLFVEKLCPPSLYTFTVLLISLYSCCQVSISLKDLPSRTYKTV